MVAVNWTLLSVIFVAIFAILGLQKGWWKEAVTTFALGILVLFLQLPQLALGFIDSINWVLEKIWGILPANFAASVTDFLETTLNLNIPGGIPQLDPTNPNTWLAMLLVFVGVAIIISRAGLRRDLSGPKGHFYRPTIIGGLLGGLLGAFNGFLVINLIREYLDGRALPGGVATTTTGGLNFGDASSFGTASSGLTIQATDLPSITVLDSAIPWVVILVGILLLVTALATRLSRDGLNIKAKKDPPYGYAKEEVVKKPPPKNEGS